jgi:hypothetical protein
MNNIENNRGKIFLLRGVTPVWYGIIQCSSIQFSSLHLSLLTCSLNITDAYYEVSKNTQLQNKYIKIKHQQNLKKVENEMK